MFRECVSLDKGFMGSFVLSLVPLSCCVQVLRLIFHFYVSVAGQGYQQKRKNEIEFGVMKQERGVFITEPCYRFLSICK